MLCSGLYGIKYQLTHTLVDAIRLTHFNHWNSIYSVFFHRKTKYFTHSTAFLRRLLNGQHKIIQTNENMQKGPCRQSTVNYCMAFPLGLSFGLWTLRKISHFRLFTKNNHLINFNLLKFRCLLSSEVPVSLIIEVNRHYRTSKRNKLISLVAVSN